MELTKINDEELEETTKNLISKNDLLATKKQLEDRLADINSKLALFDVTK